MDRSRAYVGLSTSCRRSSIAIVNSSGEIQFAQGGERFLQRNGGSAYSETLAKLIDRYCNPETDIVLALATNETLLGYHAADGDSQDIRVGNNGQDYHRSLPLVLRTVSASTLSRRCGSELLSHMEAAFEYELERLRGWENPVIDTRRYPTHLARAAAACLTGPYTEATCVVIDDSEGQSCRCYVYREGSLLEVSSSRRPKHEGSLFAFYRDICIACGFQTTLGEHWKVMALAPRGTVDPEIHALLKPYVSADGIGLKAASRPEMIALYERLDSISRSAHQSVQGAANLARTAQELFEDTLVSLLRNIHATGLSRNLVFTGECALNQSANGSLLERTDFKSLYIPSAPNADGSAVGAALLACQDDDHVVNKNGGFQTPYLGFEFASLEFEVAAKSLNSCEVTRCTGNTAAQAAQLLATGKTVGWISGRAEFASRTLGSRSILLDPRRETPIDITSSHSSATMASFSVAILHEYGPEYFDRYQTSPYGERTLQFRLKAARKIPRALRTDGRAQVQSIRRDWNERLYDLIFSFYSMTGVPMLINMNYGVSGDSLPETFEEVYMTFLTCNIDALFIGDLIIIKH